MQTNDTPNRASWSGQLSFILAAAASAIGLGNLWRFPYLAAQYGGGTFILIYLVLVVTLGFTLMVTEIAIGRHTRQSQLTAYGRMHSGFKVLGVLSTLIPFVIVPYYCVIGGWVLKYFWTYLQVVSGNISAEAALEDPGAFFGGFVSAPFAPFGYGFLLRAGDRAGGEGRNRTVEQGDDAAAVRDGGGNFGVRVHASGGGRGAEVLSGAEHGLAAGGGR